METRPDQVPFYFWVVQYIRTRSSGAFSLRFFTPTLGYEDIEMTTEWANETRDATKPGT